MKWRVNFGKSFHAPYEMTHLIARDYIEASAMVKMLLDLFARSEDGSEVITIEPYLEEKAPDGEHQEHGEEKKPEGKSFEMMITQEVENVQEL